MRIKKICIQSVLLFFGTIVNASVSTNWYYDAYDNSVALGVNAANSYALGSAWKDTEIREDDPTGPKGLNPLASATDARYYPPYARFNALWGFDALSGISTAADVEFASLYLYLTSVKGENVTWYIRGIGAADADWTEAGAIYDAKDGATAWSGGNFEDSLTGSYGSFTLNPSEDGDSFVSIDITAALQAYINGEIGGIVITKLADGEDPNGYGDNTGLNERFIFATGENENTGWHGGLEVGVIPEPAVIGLIMASAMLMLLVHRFRLWLQWGA
jgi:hypothetical protein